MGLRVTQFIGQSLVSDNLEANMIAYLNWGLMNVGAFANVQFMNSGSYGGQPAKLRYAQNTEYNKGQVWESYRKQWIWQSGLSNSVQPISISGVYVNNVFQPASGVGPFSFNIDYPNGRVIFNTPIATSSTVTAEYSYNYYQIYNADCPWWREVQRNSYRIDDVSFSLSQSGFWAKPPETRIQLPAIIIEATPNMLKKPYELGNLTCFHQQNLRMYIICETNRDRKWIVDTITNQNESNLGTFDLNVLNSSGVYPINMDTGSLNPATMNYPDLVNKFSWGKTMRFMEFQGFEPDLQSESRSPLFLATLVAKVETFI